MTFSKVTFLLFPLLILPLLAVELEWQAAQPEYSWSFPRDHWARSGYRNEWWYFTGHLRSRENPQRRFGYQFTFFRVGLRSQRPALESQWAAHNLIMGHAAISDLETKKHIFSEIFYREVPFLGGFGSYPESLIAWSRAPVGTDGTWELSWNGQGFDFEMQDLVQGIAFQLSTQPQKPLIFQGPNGYSRKGEDSEAASQYYSFTRLATEGTLSVGGQAFQVEGESWMDKEFGSNQLAENQVGWDWFSLQLEDGREVMLYHLRNQEGATDFARGTVVSASGEVSYLKPEDWRVESSGDWASPESGAQYPSHWRITLARENLELEIVPQLADQENRSRILSDLYYWEGAVTVLGVDGGRLGQGYVELTGYGTGNLLPAALN